MQARVPVMLSTAVALAALPAQPHATHCASACLPPLPSLQVSHSEGGAGAAQEDGASSGQRRTIMQRTKAALQLWKALRVGAGCWVLKQNRTAGRRLVCCSAVGGPNCLIARRPCLAAQLFDELFD